MGWFDGWFGANSKDPLAKLDPKLREFLEQESPVNLTSTQQQATKSASSLRETPAPQQKPASTNAPSQVNGDARPAVPSQSLYQDGRYADLWKTYRPLSEVEAETKTDHEKLMDVLDAYKQRRAHIGRAALENCADEQLDWNNCMNSGDIRARMTMCSAEVRKFERCYTTQSRLLKALGYLSSYDRPAEVNEEIQMHADKLFHRMLEQEAEIEKARAEGREPPKFAPLVSPSKAVTGPESQMSEEVMKEWKEKLEKLPEQERQAEMAAWEAERKANAETGAKVMSLWEEQAKEREARRAEGKETVMDKASGVFGMFGGKK